MGRVAKSHRCPQPYRFLVKDLYTWMRFGWDSHHRPWPVFVHQFRIPGEWWDQRVCTLLLDAVAGVLPLWPMFWSWTWKAVFVCKKCHQLSNSSVLPRSLWDPLGVWPWVNRFLWKNVFWVLKNWFIIIFWNISSQNLQLFVLVLFILSIWLQTIEFRFFISLVCSFDWWWVGWGDYCVYMCIYFNLYDGIGGISEN